LGFNEIMNDKAEVDQKTAHMEEVDENKLIAQRREKLASLREAKKAYRNHFRRDHFAGDLHEEFAGKTKDELAEMASVAIVAGRVMLHRVMGKASFMTIQDMTGQIQLFIRQNDLPEGVYDETKHWDLGDIVWAKGTVFKTNTGELSVKVTEIDLVTKSLRPLPEKFKGLTDTEAKYRQRYVDLMTNEETRKTFIMRTKIVDFIRSYLKDNRFMEVETPMMQVLAGGAAAKPFTTFHNALDIELFLRIAPELYLKRLVVGGFERVFEINRNFRNEGLSTRHNPEFTMLEFYQAYADFNDLMDLTEDLMRKLCESVLGNATVECQGETYDFSKSFQRLTVIEAIMKFNPDLNEADLHDLEKIKGLAKQFEVPVEPHYGLGKIQIEIFEKTAEHLLIQPTFITEYPAEVSPLARRNDENAHVTDRFEFFVGGRELANGFSELNDPEDQAARFKAQIEARTAGDDEAMPFDDDYISALEYAMPPTAGEGIGIDRLVMLLTDSPSIRDVILFPHMKPIR